MARILNAQGQDARFSLQLLVNRKPLPETEHDGRLIAALPHDVDYEILVTAPLGTFGMVMTVDGLDIMDGKRKPADKCGGYLMTDRDVNTKPVDSATYREGNLLRRIIRGYRLSDENIALFHAGGRGDSYAALMDEPENIGVIGVAFWEGLYYEMPAPREDYVLDDFDDTTRGGGNLESFGTRSRSLTKGLSMGPRTLGGATTKGGSMGTGFGRKVEEKVTRVMFQRTRFVGSIELHYDSAPVLEDLGVTFGEVPEADHFEFTTGCRLPPGYEG